jgi:RNA 3'-terminal phosphate cyclase (ATP)
VLEIDGSYGEGGGQLLRTAVALAAVTGREIAVRNIRTKRDKPGLAPQHLAAARAVAALCEAQVEGLELRSQALRFAPRALSGGEHRFDVGTAGCVTLVLQALLPAMVASGRSVSVTVTGGTDVRQAPSIGYFANILLPLLGRMGVTAQLEVIRRGYYPRGGGQVHIRLAPCTLRPIALEEPGALVAIEGHAHVANLPEHIATRMRDAALERLAVVPGPAPRIGVEMLDWMQAMGRGGAIVVWARTEHSVLGAGRVAELGVRAEALGAAAGEELVNDLTAGATADLHAADQLLVYLALAGGGSYLARSLTTHAQTAMWLIEQFLPVRFTAAAKGELVRVSVERR